MANIKKGKKEETRGRKPKTEGDPTKAKTIPLYGFTVGDIEILGGMAPAQTEASNHLKSIIKTKSAQ